MWDIMDAESQTRPIASACRHELSVPVFVRPLVYLQVSGGHDFNIGSISAQISGGVLRALIWSTK